jgi:mitochondrial ATPase complex subunit ATP10
LLAFCRIHQISRPYFRDWSNMRFHKGKTFVAPPRVFKAGLSLYFPNLHGQTLVKGDAEPRDTTPQLEGRISVVSVFSSQWAEAQVESFASEARNPALAALLAENRDRAQRVWINVEEDPMKAWLVKLFMGGLRRRIGRENWERYFLVRRGITDDIREAVGLLNSKVGYTYLVDGHCRIRWAGSGDSEDHERQGLVKGLSRLLEEQKAPQASGI